MKSLKVTVPIFLLVSGTFLGQAFIKPEALAAEGNSTDPSPALTYLEVEKGTPSGAFQSVETSAFNDSFYDRQWGMKAIRLSASSDLYQNPRRMVQVAILDSGIDRYHEDLQGKVVVEKNFTNSPSVNDLCGHGTHVAGIIAATINNSLGIAGIAPFSEIYNLKVADDAGKVYANALAESITWAVQNGADVINISIEIPEPTPELERAVDYAWENGAIIVAAASNHTADRVYPAYFPNCMAVAPIDQEGRIGPLLYNEDYVHIAAPGYSIYSTLPNNNYGYRSGTSFATAHVSGLAALIYSMAEDVNGNGELNDEVRASIESAGSDIAGSGIRLIDAASSMAQICDLK